MIGENLPQHCIIMMGRGGAGALVCLKMGGGGCIWHPHPPEDVFGTCLKDKTSSLKQGHFEEKITTKFGE